MSATPVEYGCTVMPSDGSWPVSRFRTMTPTSGLPLFEAPLGPHGWLNGIQAVGTGRLRPDGVDYSFFVVD